MRVKLGFSRLGYNILMLPTDHLHHKKDPINLGNFKDSQSKINKQPKKKQGSWGGIVMLRSTDAACSDYAFVRPFLREAPTGRFIPPFMTISRLQKNRLLFFLE